MGSLRRIATPDQGAVPAEQLHRPERGAQPVRHRDPVPEDAEHGLHQGEPEHHERPLGPPRPGRRRRPRSAGRGRSRQASRGRERRPVRGHVVAGAWASPWSSPTVGVLRHRVAVANWLASFRRCILQPAQLPERGRDPAAAAPGEIVAAATDDALRLAAHGSPRRSHHLRGRRLLLLCAALGCCSG